MEDRFSRFVKPIVNPYLSGFCKHLTSISQANVDTASKFDRVINDFLSWAEVYERDYVLCSWGEDDSMLLRNDCKLHGVDPDWTFSYTDLKKRYRSLKGMKNASGLKATVQKEGFEFTGPHHRALSDAENLGKIFVKYLEDWDLFI